MLSSSSEKELEIVRDLSRTYPSHVYYQQRQVRCNGLMVEVFLTGSVPYDESASLSPRRIKCIWQAAYCGMVALFQTGSCTSGRLRPVLLVRLGAWAALAFQRAARLLCLRPPGALASLFRPTCFSFVSVC